MNKLALYVFPFGVVAGGPFLPLAIILYWFSNNIWTFAQQHYVFGMIEKEDEAKRQEAIARRAANAPAPGAKPKRQPKAVGGSATVSDGEAGAESELETSDGEVTEVAQPQAKKSSSAARNNGPSNRTPRPGARPKKRKR